MKKISFIIGILMAIYTNILAETEWITPVDDDGNYENRMDVWADLEIPDAKQIIVRVIGETEENYDHIYIWNADGDSIIKSLHGENIDESIEVYDNAIKINFQSDYSVVKNGVTVTITEKNNKVFGDDVIVNSLKVEENAIIDGDLEVKGTIRTVPLATIPICDSEKRGLMYFNDVENQIFFCNGSEWDDLRGIDGRAGEKGDKGDTGSNGGIEGKKGDKGDTGLQGIAGLNGVNGSQGLKGDKGDTGKDGTSGVNGTNGVNGTQGAKGNKGDTGSKGYTGATGSKGEKGDTGSQGLQGEKGDTGLQGLQGIKGDTGIQGLQGFPGTMTVGAKGDKGDKGDTGIQGIQGLQGENIGIKGDKGDKGDRGDTGYQGVSGVNGTDGSNIRIRCKLRYKWTDESTNIDSKSWSETGWSHSGNSSWAYGTANGFKNGRRHSCKDGDGCKMQAGIQCEAY